MAETISAALRQLVFERAEGRCEYCLLSQTVAAHKHEPDHIIPKQHDGETSADNLALACARCNRYKGYNVGSYDPRPACWSPSTTLALRDGQSTFSLKARSSNR